PQCRRIVTQRCQRDRRGDDFQAFRLQRPNNCFPARTKPVLAGKPTELLPDFHALERWLIAAGFAASPRTRFRLRSWRDRPEAASLLRELVAYRERMRNAVMRIESSRLPSDSFVSEVNSLLRAYPLRTSVNTRGGRLIREKLFAPAEPSDL